MARRVALDVARKTADEALRECGYYGAAIEEGRAGDPALATLIAARAVILELRALSLLIEYGIENQ